MINHTYKGMVMIATFTLTTLQNNCKNLVCTQLIVPVHDQIYMRSAIEKLRVAIMTDHDNKKEPDDIATD